MYFKKYLPIALVFTAIIIGCTMTTTVQAKYGGTNYGLNSLAKYDYQKLGSFWLSHKKINGKRTLRIYLHQGVFNVLTKDKLKHNYTYQYNGANYMKQIGR